jgi:hypothetical protein
MTIAGATALRPTGGAVNIATANSTTTGAVTTAVNIASGSTTGSVTIGNAANSTTIGSATTTVAGTLNATGGIVMGAGKNITLQPQTGYVAPVDHTTIGFTPTIGVTNYGPSVGQGETSTVYYPFRGSNENFLVPGTYIISGYASMEFSGTELSEPIQITMLVGISFSETPTPSGTTFVLSTGMAPVKRDINTSNFIATPTWTVKVVTAGYYFLMNSVTAGALSTGSTVQPLNKLFGMTRIA